MSDSSILAAIKAHIGVDQAWLAKRNEAILEPELKIIDPHHHVWDIPGNRYLFDEVLADFQSGHNIVASVHVQAHSMYRACGPQAMKPVGETEFINGIAAQSASGAYGSTKMCAGIIGTVDILLGEQVMPVLEAHIQAGGGRFRGIRPTVAWHESDQVRALDIAPHILMQKSSRQAIACLDKLGLSLDIWAFFSQLEEVLDVARSFPNLTVIVNHTGGPVGIGPYTGKQNEVFSLWRQRITAIAQCPNTIMKLGGLAMRYGGFEFNKLPTPPSSELMAEKWRPYIETCIEIFGPERCMFESNFPVDRGMCNYHVLWNAFKIMTMSCSVSEREHLFHATAARIYKIDL